MTRLEQALAALHDRARHLSLADQDKLVDALETLGRIVDAARSGLSQEGVQVHVGPLVFRIDTKKALETAAKFLDAPPLKRR